MPRDYRFCAYTLDRRFARGLYAVLLVCCSTGTSFGAGSSSLIAGTGATAKTTASLPLSFVSGTGKTAGLEWTISVPGATAVAAQAGNTAGKTLSCNGATCLLAGPNSNTISNGVVVTLSVTLPSSVQGTVPVQLTNVVETLTDGQQVPSRAPEEV